MDRSILSGGILCLIGVALAAASCSSPPSVPQIRLDAANPQQPAVEVAGVSRRDLAALAKANLTSEEWPVLLRVTVKAAAATAAGPLPVAGRFAIAESVRFVPLYPLNPGLEYDVVFDTSRLSRADVPRLPAVKGVISLPAVVHAPSTVVAAVYPDGDAVPENLLRMYVHFSGPMGQKGGLDHVVLLDARGREMPDALLPLDTELWNEDRTRFTLLFDPGRVKHDILPNRSMGRPLRAGDRFTLVVKKDWIDARGVPLLSEFRREYRVGAADERALDPAAWRVAPPPPGARGPLTVTFPEPLDHGLLQRALGVVRNGAAVPGELRIEERVNPLAVRPARRVAGRRLHSQGVADPRGRRREPHRPPVRRDVAGRGCAGGRQGADRDSIPDRLTPAADGPSLPIGQFPKKQLPLPRRMLSALGEAATSARQLGSRSVISDGYGVSLTPWRSSVPPTARSNREPAWLRSARARSSRACATTSAV